MRTITTIIMTIIIIMTAKMVTWWGSPSTFVSAAFRFHLQTLLLIIITTSCLDHRFQSFIIYQTCFALNLSFIKLFFTLKTQSQNDHLEDCAVSRLAIGVNQSVRPLTFCHQRFWWSPQHLNGDYWWILASASDKLALYTTSFDPHLVFLPTKYGSITTTTNFSTMAITMRVINAKTDIITIGTLMIS